MLVSLNTSFRRRCARAAGAVAIGLLALAAPSSAFAQDDDDEETFEQGIIRNFLGGGSRPNIEYRERSPLVIPPSAELPPPDAASAAVGSPAWPNDPDRRQRSSSRKGPAQDADRLGARNLRPDELRRGTVRGKQDNRPHNTMSDNEASRPMRPTEYGDGKTLLGAFGAQFGAQKTAESEKFTGEPPRTRMVEPPAGYRTPAPTQAYQEPKEAPSKWYRALNPFDHGTR